MVKLIANGWTMGVVGKDEEPCPIIKKSWNQTQIASVVATRL
jgi:hypothetical protein